MPFAALQDGDGRYLIDRHTIATVPSIDVLARMQRLADAHRRARRGAPLVGGGADAALVVGNPSMPVLPAASGIESKRLEALPDTEEEARHVARVLGTTPLLGAGATEDAVRARLPRAHVVHLATHGIVDDPSLRSAIALAPSPGSDGFLTAREVLRLRLDAIAVVLSACDTARGEIGADGVAGLARSFATAGVPTLIASLWRVHEASTTELMEAFYERLGTAPDIAHALRDAMLATKEKHPLPVDWAAFSLIGAP